MDLAKVGVVSSNLIARSNKIKDLHRRLSNERMLVY